MKLHFRDSFLAASALFLLCGCSLSAQNAKLANEESRSQTWTLQNSGTTAGLRGIDSVDGEIAWASGTGGTVLKTTDGGQHWQKCAIPDAQQDGATLDFRGVQAWDAQTAIIMASGSGDKSRLYDTVDGCKTWILLFTNPAKDGFWDSISVADKLSLMILGDPVDGQFSIYDTEDAGKTWNRADDPGLTSTNKEGAFAASNSSLMVNWVDGPAAFGTGGPAGARLFVECDTCKSGAQWKASFLPSFSKGETTGVFSLSFRDWHRWVAVGGDYAKPNERVGTAAYSSDGGLHWTASATPPHGYRSSVAWSADLQAWITVGTNGSDISRDDGKTWQPIEDPIMRDGNWNALSLPFVVGPNGRIARLSISGKK